MLSTELERVLDKGDVEGCVALFAAVTEKERSSVAKIAVAGLRKVTGGIIGTVIDRLGTLTDHFDEPNLGQFGFAPGRLMAAQVVVLACGSLTDLKKFGMRAIVRADEAYAVLTARCPPWIDEWAEFICDLSPACWPLVRRLVREGRCQRPSGDGYIEGMLASICGALGRPKSILKGLLADPGLLEHEIWRIFEIEPRPQRFQLHYDFLGSPEQSWGEAIASLCQAGRLSRWRLLDSCLGALARDFKEVHSRWFARLHNRLSPTIADRAERTDRYLGLLHSRNGSTVSFAVKSLMVLQKAQRLDTTALVDNIRPALLVSTKATVTAALKLLSRAAQAGAPGHLLAALAAESLVHESADVQKAALDLIEYAGDRTDPNLRDVVKERLPGLAPSQRGRVTTWLQSAAPIQTPALDDSIPFGLSTLLERVDVLDPALCELAGIRPLIEMHRSGGSDIPAVAFNPLLVPRLDPERKLEPIVDLDFLMERFAALLENPTLPDEVERVLDGVSRLCDQQPQDFQGRIEPLLAQAIDIMRHASHGAWSESVLQTGLSLLAVRWAVGPAPNGQDTAYGVVSLRAGVFQRRLAGIVRRAAQRRAAPLLSAPTHAGGWIDPRVLVARARVWQALGWLPHNADSALGLLRLATDQRSAALEDAGPVEGEFGAALRHALGGDVDKIGPTEVVWAAAARARAPFKDDERVEARHRQLGPDAGRAALYRLRDGPHSNVRGWMTQREPLLERAPPVPGPSTENLAAVALHSPTTYSDDAGLHRWLGTVWPVARESFFAQGIERIVGRDSGRMDLRANRPFLEALLDPDASLMGMGKLLLVGALSAKHAEQGLLATDALIAAIDDGRMDASTLGHTLALLLPSGLLVPIRAARALAATAKCSALHLHVVSLGLQGGLCCAEKLVADKGTAAGLITLLRLLKELLIEAGEAIGLVRFRDSLNALQATGTTAVLVRELLSLQRRNGSSIANAAIRRALGHRIARAERWTRTASHHEVGLAWAEPPLSPSN